MKLLASKQYGRITMMFILYIYLFQISGFAQEEKITFESFGVKEGLPEEWAMNIFQDPGGFIWVNTQNGIIKYDGYAIEEVQLKDVDNPKGNMKLTNSMMQGKNGKFWVGGTSEFGGISSYDTKTQKTVNYSLHSLDSLKTELNHCKVLFEDVVQNIWFVSRSEFTTDIGKLCRLDPKTKMVKKFDLNTSSNVTRFSLNYSIAESKKDSSVWLVDNGDIHRYDRKSDSFALVFKKGDIIPGTKTRDTIQDIVSPGKSGLIPMANGQHLFLWDPLIQQVVESYDFPLSNDRQWTGAVFEANDGSFWMSSGSDLIKMDRKTKKTTSFRFGENQLLFEGASNEVYAIVPVLSDGDHIWYHIYSNAPPFDTYLRYDLSDQKFEWFDENFNDKNNRIRESGSGVLMKDKSGVLWFAHRPNLYKEERRKSLFNHYRHEMNNSGSIPSDTIRFLMEDRQKQLWVGTSKRLAIKDTLSDYFRTYKADNSKSNSISDSSIRFLLEDSDYNIWIATDSGVDLWNKDSEKFQKIIYNPALNQRKGFNQGLFINEDKNKKIWVSIRGKGVYVLDKKGNTEHVYLKDSSNVSVNYIFHDSKGDTWLCDSRKYGALYRISGKTKVLSAYRTDEDDPMSIVNDRIFFITEDRYRIIWIGTNMGLMKYIPSQDNFHIVKDIKNAICVPGYSFDKNNEIWFTTYVGGGIVKVDQQGETVFPFGEEKGMLHNDILNGVHHNSITDDHGKIWLPNERGLSLFDVDTKTFTNYDESYGYNMVEINSIETLKTSNGEIWIGGASGLFQTDPKKLIIKDTIAPEVHITSMTIMDRVYSAPDGELFTLAVPYSKKIELEHWQKDLGFEFVALHYLNPEGNQYSWKLENYDKTWSNPSFDRKTSYTNLPHGTYTFNVKGSNADGLWTETGASIEIVILPPWWQTWWAYIVYALLIISIGFQVHKFQRTRTIRIAREKSQKKELEQAKEIEKAYTELKATQSQLIQSEKMASLGELTAGIAHEIQNPLNFVNNFAEVSNELIDEMHEELDKGDIEEVKEISSDLKQNLDKINHHGKRADSIVKGMLQHSRTSNGNKELTDINALTDEYLRLAYHGLRAKDKSFNATMKTDFDQNMGEVKVISQDIGRVILNLISNAFYAVNERKQNQEEGYEPTVSVGTKKLDKTIEINILDNGDGIPKKVMDKIFQPFFTTKPTGQGTGLGLSMSYDIVKSHGGELKVETKRIGAENHDNKGVGTSFTIILPIG